MKSEQQDILMKVGQHFNLIEFSGDLRQLEGQFNQLVKRLDDINKRIDDMWKATKLWFTIIILILAGLNIAVLVINQLSQN